MFHNVGLVILVLEIYHEEIIKNANKNIAAVVL